jgi:flavin reductase (DIM6/NTAB) family NADH-FMN oxidoreductase RutF
MAIDPRAFRDCLGCFVTGVTVVTSVSKAGEHVGLTVNSFNSVSLDPPMVLFSLDRQAQSLPVLETAGRFAVSVLSNHQEAVSNRFARRDTDKWDGTAFRVGETGCRLIEGAMASFDCRTYAQHDGGDHVIFVGEVLAMAVDPAKQPLVYYKGRYNSLAAVA